MTMRLGFKKVALQKLEWPLQISHKILHTKQTKKRCGRYIDTLPSGNPDVDFNWEMSGKKCNHKLRC
jgi:hypothetical protein